MHLQVGTRPQKYTILVKSQFFSLLNMSKDLQNLSEQFYQASAAVNEIGNASIRAFELLYSTTFNLQQIRKQKYDTMAASDRSKIDPTLLPPSPRAAFFMAYGFTSKLLFENI